jgi:O-methyltransferase involved in polyketide biosynthesis
MLPSRTSDAISPTAHYTGYVWARNGLSHPALQTVEGRVLFEIVRPSMIASAALGQGTLEAYLMARHTAIDNVLTRAIDSGVVSQVLEVACGLSPRGWRFTQRYGDRLTYIEADLPAMASRKRRALERMDSLSDHHQVEDIDVLSEGGVATLTEGLDRSQGLAIITEGLLGYLPADSVHDVWRRFSATLSEFKAGRYFTELHLQTIQTPQVKAFRLVLSAFVRGRVYLHFGSDDAARDALLADGFRSVEIKQASELAPGTRAHPPLGSRLAHIIEASTS